MRGRGTSLEEYGSVRATHVKDEFGSLGATPERDEMSIPTAWLPYEAGDRPPSGVEAFPGREHNDLMLWVERFATVISGDTMIDFGDGLEIHEPWLRGEASRERFVDWLRPLLDGPVEHVLPMHGTSTDRVAPRAGVSECNRDSVVETEGDSSTAMAILDSFGQDSSPGNPTNQTPPSRISGPEQVVRRMSPHF